MDLSVSTQNPRSSSSGPKKTEFILKPPLKNGLVLKIHHTLTASQGVKGDRTLLFIHIAFDCTGERLVAGDHIGNLFVIDIKGSRYWLVLRIGICTTLQCHPIDKSLVLVGLTTGHIKLVNIDNCKTLRNAVAHTRPIAHLSYSANGKWMTTSTRQEAALWDAHTFTKKKELSVDSNITITKVVFLPNADHILCSSFEELCIFDTITMECIQQLISPLKELHYTNFSCSRDGKILAAGSQDYLALFSLETYEFIHVIQIAGVIKQLHFIPNTWNLNSTMHRTLFILTVNGKLYMFNVDDCKCICQIKGVPQIANKFALSSFGKYLACLSENGTINIFDLAVITQSHTSRDIEERPVQLRMTQSLPVVTPTPSKMLSRNTSNIAAKDLQPDVVLNMVKMKAILREFGEYPPKYRSLIWRKILKLPDNTNSYESLGSRGIHPAYIKLDEELPLENEKLGRSLQRLCSCLAHWSSIFSELKYLPFFVFPFLKLYHHTPIAAFETVLTVLTNWCSEWFQYFPYAPLGIMAIIENMLEYHDAPLVEHFAKHNVTGLIYSWAILEVAFTEVFTRNEWLQVWDHILSNHPSFMLIIVVAYNIMFHNTLIQCTEKEKFEFFFHNPNPVLMRALISKAYELDSTTPSDIHPKSLLPNELKPLPKGSYPVFCKFPTHAVDYQAHVRKEILRGEERLEIERQSRESLAQEHERAQRESRIIMRQEKQLCTMESERVVSINEEEEKLRNCNMQIAKIRREMTDRENNMSEIEKLNTLKKKVMHRKMQLGRLSEALNIKEQQRNQRMNEAFVDVHKRYGKLLSKRDAIEQEVFTLDDVSDVQLQINCDKVHQDMHDLEDRVQDTLSVGEIGRSDRLIKMYDDLNGLDIELCKVAQLQQYGLNCENDTQKMMELEKQAYEIEDELEILTNKLIKSKTEVKTNKLKLMHGLESHQCTQKPVAHQCTQKLVAHDGRDKVIELFRRKSLSQNSGVPKKSHVELVTGLKRDTLTALKDAFKTREHIAKRCTSTH